MVYAIEVSPGAYKLYVYEFTYQAYIFHHSMECEGIVLSRIALGYSNGHLFFITANYRNIYKQSYESYIEVYHWRARHFDPVSTQHKNPIPSSGVFDLVVWDYFGELRFAILQYTISKFGHVIGNTEIVVYTVSTDVYQAHHGSHFEVVKDQTILLNFRGYGLTYYYNGAQNLGCTSLEDDQSYYYLYSTLTRSTHFVYNNLQTPVEKGSATIIISLPHPYPDDLLVFFDNTTNTIYFYNQDLRLRFHSNFYINKASSLVDIEVLLIRENNTSADILVLVACDPPIADYAYLITVDIRPVNKSADVLVECIKELEQLINDRWDNITYLDENIDNVLVTNKDQNVTSTIIIIGVTEVSQTLAIHDLSVTTKKAVPNVTNSQILEEIIKTHVDLKEAEDESKNVVYKSGNQTINGSIIFQEDLTSIHGTIDDIHNEATVNGESITRYVNNTLKIVGDQTIVYPFVLNNLTVVDNLEVTSHLNGKDPDDLILTNASQVIKGEYIFESNVVFSERLNVYEINGVIPEYLVLTIGLQVINGLKVFDVVHVSNVEVIGTTNKQDLSEFASRVVTLDENHTISGNYEINNLYVDGNIVLEGLISNEIDVTDLANNVVTISSDGQEINGSIHFLNKLHIAGDITTDHVNFINTSQLITLNTFQHITGDITFHKDVTALQNLKVEYVNKVDVKDWVLRTEEFNITSHKVFNQSIHINGNIILDDLVTIDSVDPSELNQSIVPSDGSIDFFGPTSFENLTVLENVIFEDNVNGYNVSEVNDTFWRKTVFQHISVDVVTSTHVHFNGEVSVSEAVNEFDLDDDYVHVYGNETVGGHVQFKEDVNVLTNVIFGPNATINGYDISNLAEYIVRIDDGNFEIEGPVYFDNLTVINGDIHVNSTINGFDIDVDLLDVKSNQTLNTSITIYGKNVTRVQNITAATINLKKNGTINGVDIEKFEGNIVYINDNRSRTIENKLFTHLIADNVTINGAINNYNFKFYVDNIVTLSTNQTVHGQKIFEDPVLFEGELSLKVLNGIEFTPYVQTVINRTEDTAVRGQKIVDGVVYINGDIIMREHQEVNGIDVSKFRDRAMVHNKLQNVTGFIWFNTSTVYIKNLVVEHGTLDDVDLDKVALINRNTSLGGHITFTTEVNINGSLTVKGLVYGCDLYELFFSAVQLNGPPQVIGGSKIIDNLELLFPGNIILLPNRTVNKVDISEFAKTIIRKNGSQSAEGKFEFTTINVENLVINDILNGQNLTFLLGDVVLRDVNQTIDGTKRFTKDVHADKVKVTGNVSVETVNDVNLSYLDNVTVINNSTTSIEGNKVFTNINASEVYLEGLLNGVNVTRDLWLVYTNDSLPGITEFITETYVHGDLTVGGLIDGQNITELINERVTLSSNQSIETHLIFNDHVIVEGDCNVSGTINGVDPDHIVKTIGNFTIEGFKTFDETVHINGNVTSELINDVDIKQLSETVVRNGQPAVIQAPTNFLEEVEFLHNLNVGGTVDGIDLSEAAKNFSIFKEYVYNAIDELFARQANHTKHRDFLLDEAQDQTVVPAHLDKVYMKNFRAVELYPDDLSTEQNIPNPSAIYGLVPGSSCLSGCDCYITCKYALNGKKLRRVRCFPDKKIRLCDGSNCFVLKSPQVAASATCANNVLMGTVSYDNIPEIVTNIPSITDGAMVPSSGGHVIVVASPTDGTDLHPSSVYYANNGQILQENNLPYSNGTQFVQSFLLNVNGSYSYFLAAATQRRILFYQFNDYDNTFKLLKSHRLRSIPTGVVSIRGRYNETFIVVSCIIIDPGFLMEEKGPNLLLFSTKNGHLSLMNEAYTGSVHHMSVLKYAGDTYIVTTQTDENKIVLFRLEGPKLVEIQVEIPSKSPIATLSTYYSIEAPSNSTAITNYIANDIYMFVLSPKKLTLLRTVQFGNSINLQTGSP